ncbi:hypothetical protein BJX64DRAFT_89043 [Aspergillus heterothallicus]
MRKDRDPVCPINAVRKDHETRNLDAFVLFIQDNAFIIGFPKIVCNLLPQLSTSPVLHYAVVAIGALHEKRNSANYMRVGFKPRVAAMDSYHASMVALQACLGGNYVLRRDDVLWATFFLGLFELLSDQSGEGWVKHMLYETSKMLQLAGPSGCMSSNRQSFFDLFRILEASRSMIYSEETILSQEC